MTKMCLDQPEMARQFLIEATRAELPEGFDVEKHFNPSYRPWQQRIAVLPDGDLFKSIKKGQASVVTDQIDTFDAKGIQLASGERLDADVVITATGFDLSVMGDVAFVVDGQELDWADTVTYRGLMFTGVPNLAYVFGYFRASWTLRADLIADFVCRLLTHMEEIDKSMVVPGARRRRTRRAPALGRARQLQPRLPHPVDAQDAEAGHRGTVAPRARVHRSRRRSSRAPTSTTEPSSTGRSVVLAGHLADRYGVVVEATREIEPGGGVFHIAGPDWIARVFPTHRPMAAAEHDARVLAVVASADLSAARHRRARVGPRRRQAVLVTRFVPGRQCREVVEPAFLAQVADVLGRLHGRCPDDVRAGRRVVPRLRRRRDPRRRPRRHRRLRALRAAVESIDTGDDPDAGAP